MNSGRLSIGVIRCDQALALASATLSRWIHPLELARWQQLRSPVRQGQWLAGRWWLKRQVLERWNLGVAPSRLHILSHDAHSLGMAPQAYVDNALLPLALSLSHCEGYIAAAIGPGAPGSCGIDVVDRQLTNAAALRAWITDEEVVGGDPSQLPAAWAAKEAAFKTLAGEPFRPAKITLRPATYQAWQWSYRQADQVIEGDVELRQHSRFVLAIAQRRVPC